MALDHLPLQAEHGDPSRHGVVRIDVVVIAGHAANCRGVGWRASIRWQREDYLQDLYVRLGSEVKAGPSAAVPRFRQQVAILESCRARFESSLFEIRQLVQADLLDSELDAAKELSKHRFTRAAGAVGGVVLEKHLAQVCDNHSVKITKTKPTINDLNEALKIADVIEVPTWRFIQHLADIRNLCDHNKDKEPSQEQVDEMIAGVGKIAKTVF